MVLLINIERQKSSLKFDVCFTMVAGAGCIQLDQQSGSQNTDNVPKINNVSFIILLCLKPRHLQNIDFLI